MAKFEQKMAELERQLALQLKVDVHEVEERKNQHINELMINHDAAFSEMKNYYNDVTRENLEIVKGLQEKILNVKEHTRATEEVVS